MSRFLHLLFGHTFGPWQPVVTSVMTTTERASVSWMSNADRGRVCQCGVIEVVLA